MCVAYKFPQKLLILRRDKDTSRSVRHHKRAGEMKKANVAENESYNYPEVYKAGDRH